MTTGRINQVTTLELCLGARRHPSQIVSACPRGRRGRFSFFRSPISLTLVESDQPIAAEGPTSEARRSRSPEGVRRRPATGAFFRTLYPDLTHFKQDPPVPEDRSHRLQWRLPFEKPGQALTATSRFTKACLQVVRCSFWLGHRQAVHYPSIPSRSSPFASKGGHPTKRSSDVQTPDRAPSSSRKKRASVVSDFHQGFFCLGPSPFQVSTPREQARRSINDPVQGRPADPPVGVY